MAGRKPRRSIACVSSLSRSKRRDEARPSHLRAAPLPGTGRQEVLTRKTMAACAIAAALSGAGASEAAATACEAFRITEDGRRIALSASEAARLSAQNGIRTSASGNGISSRASARGYGSVSSSSSASASSSSRGGGTARAVSSVTDADGNRVTITRDRLGCRIIVDEQ
jgi:hypothetical protein